MPNYLFLYLLIANTGTILQDITYLTKLQYLNVSDNSITTIDGSLLPSSLIIFVAKNNPVSKNAEYRLSTIKALRNLMELDDVPVSRKERRSVREKSSESDDDEEEEEEGEEDVNTNKDGAAGDTNATAAKREKKYSDDSL
jgi:Leucine-rich repeat (LRR) protein